MLRALALALFMPIALVAQQPAMEQLKATTGRIDSVGQLRSVRELHDGRVLFPGGRGKMLVADFARQRVDTLPNLQAGALVALAADSTLIATGGAWVFLDDTRTLGMLPSTNPVVTAVPFPVGADRNGFVVGVTSSQSVADSDRVLLVHRSTGTQELVARLWAPGLPGGVPAPLFMVFEQAAFAPDGWLALVRSHPYRVDWRRPTGEWVRGAPIDSVPTKMDDREKAAYVARAVWTPPDGIHDWPKVVEPITAPQPIIAPDGSVLVKRTPTADRPGAWYDVVNRRGELVRAVLVGVWPSAQVVGFGATSVYVWATDKNKESDISNAIPGPDNEIIDDNALRHLVGAGRARDNRRATGAECTAQAG